MLRKIPLFNLLVLLSALSYFGWYSFENIMLKLGSSKWSNVQGQIASSALTIGRGGSRIAKVEYVYQVGRKEYRNNRVSLGDGVPTELGSADDFIKNHPPGTQVLIYYDPRIPARSTLYTSGSIGGNLLLVLLSWGGVVFIIYQRVRSSSS